MDRAMNEASPHRLSNPPTLAPAIGFSHAVAAAEGRLIFLGGQTGHRADLSIDEGLIAQFDQACANVVRALGAVYARPEHLVSLQIFVTDAAEYRASLTAIGEAYRRHFGKHYPAMALLEIAGLFDVEAKVELVGIAVVPDR
jgi:enamine deaminase RidA (YjgF/YER057c/UK114 family)